VAQQPPRPGRVFSTVRALLQRWPRMLRITTVTRPTGGQALLLEGRLIGPWVDELRRAAADIAAGTAIDLHAVEFADADGVTVLRRLREKGAVLLGPSGYLAALIEADGGADRDVG
jgi:hypothetical protein